MKQEPNSRGLGIPRLQAGEQVKNSTSSMLVMVTLGFDGTRFMAILQ